MKRSVSALYSSYIIDGVQMDYTPAQMLDDCIPADRRDKKASETDFDSIVDEVADHAPGKAVYDHSKILDYLGQMLQYGRKYSTL